jgi:predicted dithiol-disulfide oxidoreductase (DUF899 family)
LLLSKTIFLHVDENCFREQGADEEEVYQVPFSRAPAERKEQAGRSFSDRFLGAYLYLLFARVLHAMAEVEEQVKPKENTMNYPPIVSREEWLIAREALLIKEKEAIRARDRLNAERRRLPMVRIEKGYFFEGPSGRVSLLDLFQGRRQLILYHFMFGPDWEEGCPACSFLVDNLGHLAHLHARDTSLVLVSRAPLAKIEPFKTRMGWSVPWVSSSGSDFNADLYATANDGGEYGGVNVFLREGEALFLSTPAYFWLILVFGEPLGKVLHLTFS